MNYSVPHTSQKLMYYQGQLFDRACVLKFLLSVEESCAWVRDDLEIPYPVDDPGDSHSLPVNFVPDMLIRNWVTGRAELIQVVQEGFDDFEWLASLQRLARKFCSAHDLDWNYRVVFEHDIVLTQEQERRFVRLMDDGRARILEFSCVLFQNQSCLSDADYDCYVRHGRLPAFVP